MHTIDHDNNRNQKKKIINFQFSSQDADTTLLRIMDLLMTHGLLPVPTGIRVHDSAHPKIIRWFAEHKKK